MRCGWVKYVFFFSHVTCLDWILNINISRVWLILVALGYLMIINKYSPKWTWLVGLVYTAWIPKKVYFCQCTQNGGKMKLLMPILSLELLGGEQYLIITTELDIPIDRVPTSDQFVVWWGGLCWGIVFSNW